MVEDNSADVFLLRHALDQHDEQYILEVLRDGEEAIDFVTASARPKPNPNPVSSCWILHLPKHDGTAVLKVDPARARARHVGVVALTTLASPKDEQEVRDLGVRLYRAKPTLVEEWIRLAGEILEICREQMRAVFA